MRPRGNTITIGWHCVYVTSETFYLSEKQNEPVLFCIYIPLVFQEGSSLKPAKICSVCCCEKVDANTCEELVSACWTAK